MKASNRGVRLGTQLHLHQREYPVSEACPPSHLEAGHGRGEKNWHLARLPANRHRAVVACMPENSALPDVRFFEELLMQAKELSQKKNLLRTSFLSWSAIGLMPKDWCLAWADGQFLKK